MIPNARQTDCKSRRKVSYRVVDVEWEPAEAEHESDPNQEVHRPLHPLHVVLYPLRRRVRVRPSRSPASAARVEGAALMPIRTVGRQLQKREGET